MKMPFGKYRDWELADVPKHYLQWLRRQQWLGAWLVKEIDAVLNGEVVAPTDESFEEALGKWSKREQSECGED
jgi:hypothetical protein